MNGSVTDSKEGLPERILLLFVGGATRAEEPVDLPVRSAGPIPRGGRDSPPGRPSVPPRREQVKARSAFTLIELITVIGIMALMIVIAVPAFTNKAGAPRVGASDVANLLALVRQKAVSSKNHTAVIFSWDVATTNTTIQARVSYAPVVRTNDTVWIYLDRWSHLPKGAFFSNAPSRSVNCAFPTNGAAPVLFTNAVEFNAKGEVISSPNVFTVSEGVMMPGSLSPPSNAKYENSVSGVVYRLTGAVRILR